MASLQNLLLSILINSLFTLYLRKPNCYNSMRITQPAKAFRNIYYYTHTRKVLKSTLQFQFIAIWHHHELFSYGHLSKMDPMGVQILKMDHYPIISTATTGHQNSTKSQLSFTLHLSAYFSTLRTFQPIYLVQFNHVQ